MCTSLPGAVSKKYPTCSDVWGAADGIKLLIQSPLSHQKQLRFYNGWKSDHSVKLLLVFSVDGCICIAVINGPGNFHDSTLADYGVYSKLEHIYEEYGAKIVVDSAFKIGNAPYLIKLSQTDPFDMDLILLNREATSIHQLR